MAAKNKLVTPKSGGGWAILKRDSRTGQFLEASGKVNVVRNVTMPNGTIIRVVRKDALERALSGSASPKDKG